MKKLSVLFFISIIIISCNQKKTNEAEQKGPIETIDASVALDGVYFIFPKDGETVNNPVMVGFGVRGMEVAPAGQVIEGEGHHHIVIDGQYVEEGTIVPTDATHIHYGKGQRETKLELTAGKHTLTMQFADGVHKSYGEAWSKKIEITVVDTQ